MKRKKDSGENDPSPEDLQKRARYRLDKQCESFLKGGYGLLDNMPADQLRQIRKAFFSGYFTGSLDVSNILTKEKDASLGFGMVKALFEELKIELGVDKPPGGGKEEERTE